MSCSSIYITAIHNLYNLIRIYLINIKEKLWLNNTRRKLPLTLAKPVKRAQAWGNFSLVRTFVALTGPGEHILSMLTLDYSNRSRRFVSSTTACLDTGFKSILSRQTFQGRRLEWIVVVIHKIRKEPPTCAFVSHLSSSSSLSSSCM